MTDKIARLKPQLDLKVKIQRFFDAIEGLVFESSGEVDMAKVFSCPECGDPYNNVFGFVPHVNDRHGWSFEQIADWLEENKNPKLRKVVAKVRDNE